MQLIHKYFTLQLVQISPIGNFYPSKIFLYTIIEYQFITFEGLCTTFEASLNVFTMQVCLYLVLVNDDTSTKLAYNICTLCTNVHSTPI